MPTKSVIRSRLLRVLAIAGVTAAVMVPATALAQDYPTPNSTPVVAGDPGDPGVYDPGDPGGGELPVTGGELAGLTLAGLGVAGAGAALVVWARRPRRADAGARA